MRRRTLLTAALAAGAQAVAPVAVVPMFRLDAVRFGVIERFTVVVSPLLPRPNAKDRA